MSRSWLNIMTFGLALIFVGCGSETSGSQSEMDAEIATDAVVIQDMSADVGSVDVDADIDAMLPDAMPDAEVLPLDAMLNPDVSFDFEVEADAAAVGDTDGDGINDELDNCVDVSNPNQLDSDQRWGWGCARHHCARK